MINDTPTKILDHGYVQLVDVMGDDEAVEAAARTSYVGGDQEIRTVEQRRKLIRYLMEHRHTTPFEMVVFKFQAKMPIFVARQWVRYRMSSLNEVSARYTELPEEYYIPEVEQVLAQSTSSKQGRGGGLPDDVVDRFRIGLVDNSADAFRSYRMALTDGVAREVARVGLPLSTYTTWVWKMDLHNLFGFLQQRLHSHAQWEIRQYAEAIASRIRERVPLCWEAFDDFRLRAVTLSRAELEELRANLDPVARDRLSARMLAKLGFDEKAPEQ